MAVAVVDAHHHLIDTQQLAYPWIEEPRPALTALLANYYDIAHDYDVQSYSADVGSERPAAAVACEFGARDGLAEARYVQRCAEEWGWPSAFIAAVDLTSPKLDETLAAYQELPIVRAVRQPLYWANDPLRRLGARPDFLSDAAWLRGFESVAATDLTWDLLVYDEQLPAAEELLRSFPSTRIVLEATGWPLDQSPDGYRGWEERLRSVAEHPQVTLKLQGLALIFGPTRSRVEPWVRTALSIFGARRCMFASHFPVDRLLWSWDEMLGVLEAVCDELPEGDRYEFFSGCARREYRLQA
jgi:predicted TIM-barrel fold metal-dependent hydrolase